MSDLFGPLRRETCPRRRAVLFPLVGTLVLMSGCTSSSPRSAPSTEAIRIHSSDAPVPGAEAPATVAADSCPVVGRARVERRFGGRVVREQVGVGPLGSPTCTFVLAASNVGRSGVVTASRDAHATVGAFARARAAYPTARSVAGVGDGAFYVADVRLLQMIVKHTIVVLRASVTAPASALQRPDLLRHDLVWLAEDIAAAP